MKYEIFIREDKKPAPFYKKAIAEYEKRLGRYCKISYKLVRKEKDWLKLMSPEPDRMAFWVVAGKDDLSSEGLSRMIADWENSGVKKIIFLVDQPAEESEERSSWRGGAENGIPVLSLSGFAMPAAMTGMILYEQIYRGYRILHNQPYHK